MKLYALIVMLAAVVVIQDGPYRPTDQPVSYSATNDYLMWFVMSGDTVGQPVHTTVQETHQLSATDSGLSLKVELSGAGFRSSTDFGVDASGRVATVDGRPVDGVANARVDVLPRIPLSASDLGVGTTWSDSVSIGGSKDFGENVFEVGYHAVRSYRVVDRLTMAGEDVRLIVASGQLGLRQANWSDGSESGWWWQDVNGSVVDSVWFSVSSGRLLQDATHMDLTGTGGFVGIESHELPSGLRSSSRRVPSG